MTARIIDGKAIASELRVRVAGEVARVKREAGLTPGLAVVLVGNDPASEVYVRSKHTQTQGAGMASFEHRLPADAARAELLAKVLGVPKARVKILSGTTSRLKQVAVGGDPKILGETLRQATAPKGGKDEGLR